MKPEVKVMIDISMNEVSGLILTEFKKDIRENAHDVHDIVSAYEETIAWYKENYPILDWQVIFDNLPQSPTETERDAKTFEEVEIGDKAFENDCFEFQGKVIAKGTFKNLIKTYESTWGIEDIDEDEEFILDECVAISQSPGSTLEGYTSLIFLYNYDPSSVICFKD